MKIDLKHCTEEELWEFVAAHLSASGIDAVLVGGSVVSIYTGGIYRSGDLDFIVTSLFTKKLPEAMKAIGFVKLGKHYEHPECPHLFVEFPPGPLAIGDDVKIEPAERRVRNQVIRILSPTDCIKDRLASYIHFKSRDTLEQAVLVAQKQPYDAKQIRKWCKAEGAEEVFTEFINLVG